MERRQPAGNGRFLKRSKKGYFLKSIILFLNIDSALFSCCRILRFVLFIHKSAMP